MKNAVLILLFGCMFLPTKAQWKEVSEAYGLTTENIQVFEWEGNYHDSAFRAFYVKVNTKDKKITINTDTTLFRRLTPMQFYDRLHAPAVVVNASFFEFKKFEGPVLPKTWWGVSVVLRSSLKAWLGWAYL